MKTKYQRLFRSIIVKVKKFFISSWRILHFKDKYILARIKNGKIDYISNNMDSLELLKLSIDMENWSNELNFKEKNSCKVINLK